MKHESYDLIVIGAGAGGLNASRRAIQKGKTVLLVEKFKPGGDCTWVGCIPSKALIQIADEIHTARKYASFSMDSISIMNKVRAIVQETHRLGESIEVLAEEGIDYLNGTAVFENAHVIRVGDRLFKAERIVISTGSSSVVPPIPGLSDVDYLTNENIFDLKVLPKDLIVVGGGAIGVELSQALNRLGVRVTLVEQAERILPREEAELSRLMETLLLSENLDVHAGCTASEISEDDGQISLLIEKDGNKQLLRAEKVLIALGRKPNLRSLNFDDVGIEYNARGIIVNEFMQTSIPHIYAVGDLAGPYLFSHMGGIQGRLAADHAFDERQQPMTKDYAWCTFTHPELARTGLTEAEAFERYGDSISVYTQSYGDVDRAVVDEKTAGLAKVVCDADGYVLGASIFGERACELLGELQLLKTFRIPLSALQKAIHPYPSYSELLLGLSGQAASNL